MNLLSIFLGGMGGLMVGYYAYPLNTKRGALTFVGLFIAVTAQHIK